jgi:pimeloyl-ACP methyl ester carboxylesterase
MPEARRPSIAESMRGVRYWAHALYNEPTPAAAFRELRVPVLYMLGGRSPASSLGVFDVLSTVLPAVHVVRYEKLGHMGPVTHPELVNEEIERWLARPLS